MSYLLFNKYKYLTPLSVYSNESRFVSDSLNLRRQVIKKNAQRFEFEITVSDGVGATLHADLMTNWLVKGMETPFEIDVPQHLYTDNLTSQTQPIVVQSLASSGAGTVNITSALPFSIPAGRYITFSNHSKLYVVTESITNQTAASLKVSPSLTDSLPINTIVKINSVKATVLNEADNATFAYDAGVIQSATLKFIEYLN